MLGPTGDDPARRAPMFARITALHFVPDKAEQGFDIVQHSVVPTIKEQAGFKGLLLLRDPETGGATTVNRPGERGGSVL
jgi:hypothetical protein